MSRGRILGVCVAAGLFFAGAALAQTTQPATTSCSRLPVPSSSAIAAAQKQLQDICRNRLLGAAQLRQLSLDTPNDPALRYATGLRAIDLAAAGGDVRTALAAAADVSTAFHADPIDLQVAIIERLLQNKYKRTAVLLAMRTVEVALKAGRPQAVEQLSNCLQSHGAALDPALQPAAADVIADAKVAMGLRTTSPALYAAFYQQSWEENLPAIARSSEYAEVAIKDQAARAEPERLAVADLWWQAGQSRGALTGHRLAGRAVQIYQQLLSSLRGAHRELALARLSSYQREALRWQGVVSGVGRRFWREGVRDSKVTTGTVPALTLATDDPIVPKDCHVVFRTSLLAIASGQYQLTFIAGSTLRVTIDGQVVVDNPKAYAKRTNGEKLPITLTAGLHEVEIEVTSKSSQPNLKVTWMTPASPEDRPIPAEFLFQDSLGTLP
jgi:hypothetical protein